MSSQRTDILLIDPAVCTVPRLIAGAGDRAALRFIEFFTVTIAAPDADTRRVLGMFPFYQQAIQSGMPFPKTRRIVFLKNKPATLAGWVELRVQA